MVLTNNKVINRMFFERYGIEIMNRYMRAIGFSNYKKKQLQELFERVRTQPDIYRELESESGEPFFEMSNMAGKCMGVTWSGILEQDGTRWEYCYPFVTGTEFMQKDSLNIEEKTTGNSYTGAFEDLRSGAFIIFFLQNGAEYLKYRNISGNRWTENVWVALSALSLDGTVLLPLAKSEQGFRKKEKEQKMRIKLLAEAKQGDEKAMESLAFQDMDTYTKVSKRIRTEDIFTIVESSFMPYGLECDLYSIVADIISAEKIVNAFTGEGVWLLGIDYNGIPIKLCINEQDVIGEPKAGRRFKGNLWLQGTIKI